MTIEESGSGRVKVEKVELWRAMEIDAANTTPVSKVYPRGFKFSPQAEQYLYLEMLIDEARAVQLTYST